MRLVHHSSEIPKTNSPIIFAMGCFDGVHLGHQSVISMAVEQAAAVNGEAWVFTFDPHPASILSPKTAPPLISAATCRLRTFSVLGVHGVISIPFDTAYAQIKPNLFLSTLREEVPLLKGIVCGIDWTFGYKAGGNFQALEVFCTQHDMTATAVQPVLYQNKKISSTHIRQAVRHGDIPLAERMLGRSLRLFGTVVKGHGIGRKLGFPTANLKPENELLPAPGIYAAWTQIQKSTDSTSDFQPPTSEIPSAVFIGIRKTFADHQPVIEAHLLDFEDDLYGQLIEISLIQRTHNILSFPSKEALIEQIKKDIIEIRALILKQPLAATKTTNGTVKKFIKTKE